VGKGRDPIPIHPEKKRKKERPLQRRGGVTRSHNGRKKKERGRRIFPRRKKGGRISSEAGRLLPRRGKKGGESSPPPLKKVGGERKTLLMPKEEKKKVPLNSFEKWKSEEKKSPPSHISRLQREGRRVRRSQSLTKVKKGQAHHRHLAGLRKGREKKKKKGGTAVISLKKKERPTAPSYHGKEGKRKMSSLFCCQREKKGLSLSIRGEDGSQTIYKGGKGGLPCPFREER